MWFYKFVSDLMSKNEEVFFNVICMLGCEV